LEVAARHFYFKASVFLKLENGEYIEALAGKLWHIATSLEKY